MEVAMGKDEVEDWRPTLETGESGQRGLPPDDRL